MTAAPPLTLLAPAKLNLGLEIVGRRPDGYHEIVTLFQTVALHDTLTIAPGPDLALRTDPARCGDATGDDNLVLRAARVLAAHAAARGSGPDRPRGATLTLEKRIPAAAGLGGGSSDAAAALRGLRRFWGLPVTDAELAALAAGLGADVPFFLRGGTALATGIGERLEALPPLPPAWFVVLTPALPLPPDKTRRLYHALTPTDFGDGARTLAQAARLRRGDPLDPALLVNTFATPLARLFPAWDAWRRRFLDAGAAWALPSGSGPSLFAGVPDEAAGHRLAASLVPPGGDAAEVHVVRAIDGPRPDDG